MKLTSAQAHKLLKKLEEDKNLIIENEIRNRICSSTIEKSTNKVIFSNKTEYSFSETEKELQKVISDIVKLRHAINVVNTTVEIATEYGNMTVDQILVMLPQLNDRQWKLKHMMSVMPKESRLIGSTDNIQVDVINYSIDDVKEAYAAISKKITDLQLALDKHNQTYEFEIEI